MASPPSTRATPAVVHQGIAYSSGQLPRRDGQLAHQGRVGADISAEEAREAAAISADLCLDNIEAAAGGKRIVRVLKVLGFVRAAEGFVDLGQVIDGASDRILERYGQQIGAHARSAIGVAELPHGAPVEIEVICALEP